MYNSNPIRIIALLFLLTASFGNVSAQTDKDADRLELKNLLDERKVKFDEYSTSLEKRSGIFGYKTKNDIRKSQGVLIDIVKTDNRIISALYRVVDFRTFAKVNMNYDLHVKDETVNNLKHAADTLSKQVDVLKTTNHALQSRLLRWQWSLYIFCLVLCAMIIYRWRKSRALKVPPGVE